jgi:hypothetical protein
VRSVARCLLLVLTVVCVIQTALHSATFHVPIRHQWRMQTQEQGAAHLSGRNTIAVPGDWPETPVPALAHPLAPVPRRDVQSRFSVAVFVPPRV